MLADRSPYGASFLVGSPAFRIILAASCNNNGRISPLCFPPLSTIEITTFQLFCLAFASAAAITFRPALPNAKI